MSLNEFLAAVKELEEYLKGAAGSMLSKVDRATYAMLINTLKSEDPEAVKIALDQLVIERREVSIPPVYLVSAAHPVPWVRQQANKALNQLVSAEELNKVTQGKDVKSAVKALVDRYGHFRS